MPGLQFTTVVEAPLTVAFDVARRLGRPWTTPLLEVESHRPFRDVYQTAPGRGGRRLVHSREFSPTGDGTRVVERLRWAGAAPPALSRALWRPRAVRAVRCHLDAYAAVAGRRALDVVQVVGAAVVRGDQVLVAQRRGGRFDGQWEFPGGKVEPGERHQAALVRECQEELGVVVVPTVFLGEVVLDVGIGGAPPGTSTMRVWVAQLSGGEPEAREHADLRWVRSAELSALDWIAADRPLLPAVRTHLARRT